MGTVDILRDAPINNGELVVYMRTCLFYLVNCRAEVGGETAEFVLGNLHLPTPHEVPFQGRCSGVLGMRHTESLQVR